MPRTVARIALLAGLVAALLVGGTVPAESAPVGATTGPNQGGRVIGWGYEYEGSVSPPQSLREHNVVAVAGGLHFSLALTAGGHVFAWGANDYNTLAAPYSGHYTAIAAGVTHALALTADGRVVAWGNNDAGQTEVPASLNGKVVTAIAAGRYTSLALTSDGKVTVWGYDEFAPMAAPASLDGKTVVAIAASYSHALAVTSDGKVTAWGSDRKGESTLPPALDGQTVTGVAAGTYTSLALTSGGNVIAWGTNDYHQLRVPGALAGKAVAIAAGYGSAGALTNDGKAVMWGEAVPNGGVADGRYLTALALGADSHVLAISRNLHPTSTPALGGANVGQAVHAVQGTWTDPVSTHHYTWHVDGHVAGHGATFTPVAAQQGKQLTLTVGATATDTEKGTAHVTTAPVTIGLGTFSTVPKPVITGVREAGRRLVASISGVDPAPDSVTWVWKRFDRGVEVVIGHGATYYPTEDDVRKSVSAYATVHKAGYQSASAGVSSGLIKGCTTYC